jgi:hypothetical protein
MQRFGWLGIAALLAIVASGCSGSPKGETARSTAPSLPSRSQASSSATSTRVTTAPMTLARVGDTLPLSANPVLGPGTPSFNVTLNQVTDPAQIQVPSHPASPRERYVEVNVTIANVGSAPLPVQYGYLRRMLGFTWYLNPSYSVPDSGARSTQDFPNATCQGTPRHFTQDEVAPGQSITGCVQFGPLSDSIVVTGFEASLAYGGYDDLYPAIWQIS